MKQGAHLMTSMKVLPSNPPLHSDLQERQLTIGIETSSSISYTDLLE